MALRRSVILIVCLVPAASATLSAEAETSWPRVAFPDDSVPISFRVQ